jgi:prepilin-type N-terminal cleavage/methylation domain-containing protein
MIRKAAGFTLIEILVVIIIAAILNAVAVPILGRARMSGNESSAIAALRTIYNGQQNFYATCGYSFYAPTLMALGVGDTPNSIGFVSKDLSLADPTTKQGYVIDLVPGPAFPGAPRTCNGLAPGSTVQIYSVTGGPNVFGQTGSRYFVTNQKGTIYEGTAYLPPFQNAPPTGATPIK